MSVAKKLLITTLLIILVIGLVYLTSQERPVEKTSRTDLPWLISVHQDGTSTVLDLHLGEATLEDAIAKFGPPEGIALFAEADEPGELEVYFGTVSFGPLKAKVIINLAASADEKKAMIEHATAKKTASNRDVRFSLSPEDQEAAIKRHVTAITYIPDYSGLEADFFRERLGEPAAWKREDEERILWFYPDKGLTLLIDADGKEVLQYYQPRSYKLPQGAQSNVDK